MSLYLVISGPRGANPPPLQGKPVVLATVRSGSYGAGTPRAGWNRSMAYLPRCRSDRGRAGAHARRVNPALDEFEDLALQMHADALSAAAGRILSRAQVSAA